MKLGNFENKVVIVSGGSSGIGKCITEQFVKENAKVIIIDKNDCNTKCDFFFNINNNTLQINRWCGFV